MDRLDALKVFVRLVDLGSFSAAAREMRISQSTASKALASLEASSGVTLVQRTTRALRVTAAGAALHRRAQEITRAYDDAITMVQEDAREHRGTLRVSVPVVFGRRFAVPTVDRYLRANPAVAIDLRFDDRYVSLVDEGFDLAIRHGVPVDTSARARVLATSPRRLFASPAYLAVHGRPARPGDLRGHVCLIHSDLPAARIWSFGRGGRVYRASVRGRLVANQTEAVLDLARAGHGVALLASWLADEALAQGDVVALLPDFVPAPASVQALTPAGATMAPHVRVFLDMLQEDIRRLLGRPPTAP